MQATVDQSVLGSRCPRVELSGQGRVADRFSLIRLLGTGSTGAVWLAEDAWLDRHVALKRVDRDNPAARAIEEARAAAAVQHPNTVRVHDVVSDDVCGVDWLVMEALSGHNLADVLGAEQRLGEAETSYIARSVLAALQSIHDAGFVHRDVKPANIQLCDDGRVVLLDFGLAAPPAPVDPVAVVGSLPYLAPEIFRGGEYSPASDLYAMGMTLFAALTGEVPPVATCEVDSGRRSCPEFAYLTAGVGSLARVVAGLVDPDLYTRLDARRTRRLLGSL